MGFEAFSYADLAERVGIRSASIHHHFRYKHDLVAELLLRYRLDFAQRVDELNAIASAPDRLVAYARLVHRGRGAGTYVPVRHVRGRVVVHRRCRPGRSHRLSVRTARPGSPPPSPTALSRGYFLTISKPGALAEVMLVALEGALLLARAGDQTPDATTIMKHMLRTITPSSVRPVKVEPAMTGTGPIRKSISHGQ